MNKLFTLSQTAPLDGSAITPNTSGITADIVGLRVEPANPANVDMNGDPGDASQAWVPLGENKEFAFPMKPLPQFRSNSGSDETINFVFILRRW